MEACPRRTQLLPPTMPPSRLLNTTVALLHLSNRILLMATSRATLRPLLPTPLRANTITIEASARLLESRPPAALLTMACTSSVVNACPLVVLTSVSVLTERRTTITSSRSCNSPCKIRWARISPGSILWLTRLLLKRIQSFYPPGSLEPLAHHIATSGALHSISAQYRVTIEIAMDLVRLALFDVVLYIDDSGSMSTSRLCCARLWRADRPCSQNSRNTAVGSMT